MMENRRTPCVYFINFTIYSLVRINVIYRKMIATQLAYWTKSAFHTYDDCAIQSTTECCIQYYYLSNLGSVSFDVMWWCLRPMNITTFSRFNFHLSFIAFGFLSPLIFAVLSLFTVYFIYRISCNVAESFKYNMLPDQFDFYRRFFTSLHRTHKTMPTSTIQLFRAVSSCPHPWAFRALSALCLLTFKCSMKT